MDCIRFLAHAERTQTGCLQAVFGEVMSDTEASYQAQRVKAAQRGYCDYIRLRENLPPIMDGPFYGWLKKSQVIAMALKNALIYADAIPRPTQPDVLADPGKVMSAEDFSKRLLHMGYNQMPDTCDYIHAYAQNIITERDASIRTQAIDETLERAAKTILYRGCHADDVRAIRALKTTGGSR